MQPKTYLASEHEIDHTMIDADALYVLQKLKDAGYTAYLVGGSVRDLLIKQTPKDYDISTSAKPEEIKQLFHRSCLLIGRRFRLAHIRFKHKIIEVSTFRSGDNESDLILHDNQWGSPEEDVLRRDFTINGLFYDPSTHTIIDFVGGWEDIQHKLLRTIGNPSTRFKQDPVRMIRLLKFRARFGFEIDSDSKRALIQCRTEIMKSSPARVLEEIFRMLESGAAAPFFHLMAKGGILELLFPLLNKFLANPPGEQVYRYLKTVDYIHQNAGKNLLERAVLSSCLLFPILQQEVQKQYIDQGKTPHMGEIMMLTSSIIKEVVTSSFTHFPRRLSSTMAFVLAMQFRLTPLSGKRHCGPKLMRNKEFIYVLKFLKVRSLVDKSLEETYAHCKNLWKQQVKHGYKRTHPITSSHMHASKKGSRHAPSK
ncbi:polynucleotide adenylyltransferase PcnB [Parachlamydia sp. AcF125]|uniref:polynucleotide adenylyltransferase PcnB n=1 Tax=Parachlamydia sp. AcF125 TaxID=2795736 RepID=UPI001BC9D6BD|nr:Poly(A) polymerase I [Parachlamydia sp. AcF125]